VRVIRSPDAREDVREIADSIATDNRRAAARFVDGIESRCRGLNTLPDRFPVAFPIDPPVRQRLEGRHRIFYSVREDHVPVERVLDSARDVSGALFPR